MIRVLVVEEVRAVGEMIAAVLHSESDIEVVAHATNFQEIKANIACCEVVLVNAGRHGETSLPLIQEIHQLAAHVKIVVIGLVCTQSFVLQCVEAGVTGYALRDSSLSELLRTIRAAYNNEALVSSATTPAFMSYITELAESSYAATLRPEIGLLTRREREVLTLMQQGLTNQEIAQMLVIELGTVKNHVHNILRKLNINSRRDTLHLSRTTGLWRWKEPVEGKRQDVSTLRGLEEHTYPSLARAAS